VRIGARTTKDRSTFILGHHVQTGQGPRRPRLQGRIHVRPAGYRHRQVNDGCRATADVVPAGADRWFPRLGHRWAGVGRLQERRKPFRKKGKAISAHMMENRRSDIEVWPTAPSGWPARTARLSCRGGVKARQDPANLPRRHGARASSSKASHQPDAGPDFSARLAHLRRIGDRSQTGNSRRSCATTVVDDSATTINRLLTRREQVHRGLLQKGTSSYQKSPAEAHHNSR